MTATVPTVIEDPNINRGTSNIVLPAEVSQEIWAKVLEESVFMRLATKTEMPGSGKTIQTITGEPEADWVDETDPKPVSTHSFGKKSITPYKLAVIEPFSMEFIRDKKKLYNECVRRLPKALSKKFDSTVIGTSAPGSGFDVLGSCTKVSLLEDSSNHITAYDRFVAIDGTIAAADGIMNGIALATQGKSLVLGAKDGQGHPLFTPGVESNTIGNILGSKVIVAKSVYKAGTAASGTSGQAGYVAGVPAIVGVAGDWDDALYGTVEGVKMDISKEATLITDDGIISLFQQNMVAVRVEIEVGFVVKSTSEFVLLTGNIPTA